MAARDRGPGFTRGLAAAVLVGVLAGCLLPKPPPSPRYFAPIGGTPEPQGPPVAVQIGVVRSPVYLREPMTWRRSDVEYGFYDQRRWTELPATYVEQALVRELSPEATSSRRELPVLTTSLRAFDEVLSPVHEARVALAVELVDGRCVRLRRTIAAATPLSTSDPTAVARGIGEALDQVVGEVGAAVRSALAERTRCDA